MDPQSERSEAVVDFSVDKWISISDLQKSVPSLERAAWIATLTRGTDGYFMQDGEFSKALFGEALACYVGGHFIASIVLGFSLIERSLAGRLSHVGPAMASKGKSQAILASALKKGWLSQEEHDELDRIREFRNPVAHFRDPLDESRPEIRAVLNAKTGPMMLEADARTVMRAALNVAGKTSL
ncbi:MAG: hypothetical protein C0434_09360 [Xanthomonadaceae bacterium]|nr:hypothetical protein [Xanthomonadaceae bacterium]